MKTVSKVLRAVTFILLLTVSNITFSQNSNDPASCTDYPTSDETLDGLVKSLVGSIFGLDSNMSSIYSRLSSEEQQLALAYMANSDKNLFQRFPQFEDIEIQNGVNEIKSAYNAVLARFGELFPNTSSNEQVEKIKNITKCCAAKVAKQKIEKLDARVDPCKTTRTNCLVSAASQATIGHLGCAALDLSIIGGIICHAAVFAYQISESNICDANYKQCKEGQ